MTSAAAEKEINKWQLWGVNKLLEVNVSLSLTQEKNGNPPTLDLVKQIYHENEEEAKELLKDAQSSLKHMDIKWVIFGACEFLNNFPLRTSKKHGHVLLQHSDVFRTFGKKVSQGAKLYVEAGEAYLRFRKLRDLNNMSIPQFIKDYLPAHIMGYNFHPRSVEQGPGSIVDTSTPEFKIDMFTSSNLFEQVEAEMTTATPRTPQTLFELIKLTSYKDYNASSQGWHDENKLEEMADEDMRYLVVRLEGGHFPAPEKQWTKNPKLDQSIIGFLSFMITQEEDENVVYIYEIHISEHYREYGLGRHLFSMVEHIGKVTGMDKAMLTVFKRNTHARRWYDARGYSVDEISPRPRKLRGGRSIEPDYEILSKRLQERAAKRINRDVRC
jgi:ribosomal protein S18 acetylase RimI-like enzyme